MGMDNGVQRNLPSEVEADLNLAKGEKAMLDAGLQENTAGGRP
jgi:hypothetical protein